MSFERRFIRVAGFGLIAACIIRLICLGDWAYALGAFGAAIFAGVIYGLIGYAASPRPRGR